MALRGQVAPCWYSANSKRASLGSLRTVYKELAKGSGLESQHGHLHKG